MLKKTRSFLRWAGSKRKLLPKLRAHWPGGDTRYIEPFVGSACLFFDVTPAEAVLGDLNEELVCAYRMVKLAPGRLIECLRRIPLGKQAYYDLRSIDPATLSELERAARFVYLNRYCFNGLYRTNTRGEFNVPFGRTKTATGIDEHAIWLASKALQCSQLICGDFENTLACAEAGDFVYLDPPFAVSKRRVFVEYQSTPFSIKDLSRLHDALLELDKRGAKFLVSYADCSEGRQTLSDWNPVRVRTRRHIAGFASNRRTAYELLASNAPAGG